MLESNPDGGVIKDEHSKLLRRISAYRSKINKLVAERERNQNIYHLVKDDEIAEINARLRRKKAAVDAEIAATREQSESDCDSSPTNRYGNDISLNGIKASVKGVQPKRGGESQRRNPGATTTSKRKNATEKHTETKNPKPAKKKK
jgi:hypothetical protein